MKLSHKLSHPSLAPEEAANRHTALVNLAFRQPRVVGSSPEALWMNADDRLSFDPFSRAEGGDCVLEGGHVADVRP